MTHEVDESRELREQTRSLRAQLADVSRQLEVLLPMLEREIEIRNQTEGRP